MRLIDTHTHPHMAGNQVLPGESLSLARAAGVEKMICVGTDATDSKLAIELSATEPEYAASVGLHPHEAKFLSAQSEQLAKLARNEQVVAIGECGLDYFYHHSDPEAQKQALRWQLSLAHELDLPVIFHVREAFDDFWQIYDDNPIRGVIHSFTATAEVLKQCLDRGLYIGLNGIMTFTKDKAQLVTAQQVPLEKLLLETDAPFLTPVPYRGKVNHSGHVKVVAEFLSHLRSESLVRLTDQTTANAQELFRL